ncbi:MAG: C4-dicarboxylate ABC transporter substrate-binding protein, partial [Betaproteobacteria bacterium]
MARVLARLNGQFGQGPVLAASLVLLLCVVASLVAFGFFDTAAPSTLTITSGPEGSGFKRNAEQYKKILAKQGVTLKILPSEGSHDNMQRLANPKVAVDVGFVLGGEANSATAENLVSLGSVSYQPLMIFYRGAP